VVERRIQISELEEMRFVGEPGKNLTPSKRWVCRNSWKKFANQLRDESSNFVKVRHSWRDPDKSQVFKGFPVICKNNSRIWFLRVNLLSISGWLKSTEPWNQELVQFWNLTSAKP
jgi:hypothetical protein